MNKFFYSKIAANNIKNNSKTYVPYLITCILTISMYYIMHSLSINSGLDKISGGGALKSILFFGTIVLAFFSAIFLFYTHSFLIKKRKKEFGLYNILGMEKKHIFKIMFFETIYTVIISFTLGLGFGVIFSKLFYLILLKMLNFHIPINFEISMTALYYSLIIFGVIFILSYLNTLTQIHLSKPIELIKGNQTGEKEPKTKWIMTIIGIITLGAGYYISLTTQSPLEAIALFFVAVILVIIGTYLLFITGSITILKMLRKNKNYYYKTKNFTAVSGMIYRMKQNAVGLANICILSTAVLVMLSTTVSLFIGMEDLVRTRYPRDFVVSMQNFTDDDVIVINEIIQDLTNRNDMKIKNEIKHQFVYISAPREDNKFLKTSERIGYQNISNIRLITVSEYNKMTGKNISLNKDEVLLQTIYGEIKENTIIFEDKTFKIKERIDDIEAASSQSALMINSYYIVFSDKEIIEEIYLFFANEELEGFSYYYGFDIDSKSENQIQLYNELVAAKNQKGFSGLIESSEEARESFYSLYGGLFFIAIFLGTLFLIATVLIIYYKQISEGFDDKQRFEIMQKVGMSHEEVKSTIRNQVLTVFFLPLIMSGVHIAFAFPIITKMLAVLNLTNTPLFIKGLIGTLIIFALFYTIVYSLTAKAYYKIVSYKN